MLNHFKYLLVFIFTFLSTSNSFSQCAMCKAVVETGDVTMAEGINNGITYLMVFPYLLIVYCSTLSIDIKKALKINISIRVVTCNIF